MQTMKTALHSGVMCEFKLITGAMQAQMTLNNDSMAAEHDPMTTLLSMAIVKLGDNPPTLEHLQNMLVTDRNVLLLKLRLLSYGNTFEFPLTWEVGGVKETIRHSVELNFDDFALKNTPQPYNNYQEVLADLDYEMTTIFAGDELPTTVVLQKLTYKNATDYVKQVGVQNVNFNSFIEMRKPRIKTIDEDSGKVRLQKLDIQELLARDVETIRKAIYQNEGFVKTDIEVQHPAKSHLTKKINVLDNINFFFYQE